MDEAERREFALRRARDSRPLTIGFAGICDFRSLIGHEYIEGVSDAAHRYGVNLVNFAGSIHYSVSTDIGFIERYRKKYRYMKRALLDGLVVWASSLSVFMDPDGIRGLHTGLGTLPMVDLGVPLIDGVPTVSIDPGDGVRAIMEHLVIGHGFGRIAFVGCAAGSQYRDRFDAWLAQMERFGLPVLPGSVFVMDRLDSRSGHACAEELYRRFLGPGGSGVDAVVTVSDVAAAYIVDELANLGVRIPEDVAITGMNNQPGSMRGFCPVTTVDLAFYERGSAAVGLLIDMIAEPGRGHTSLLFGSKLVVRQSCGCFETAVHEAGVADITGGANVPRAEIREAAGGCEAAGGADRPRAVYGADAGVRETAGTAAAAGCKGAGGGANGPSNADAAAVRGADRPRAAYGADAGVRETAGTAAAGCANEPRVEIHEAAAFEAAGDLPAAAGLAWGDAEHTAAVAGDANEPRVEIHEGAAGFGGGPAGLLSWLRERFREDPGFRNIDEVECHRWVSEARSAFYRAATRDPEIGPDEVRAMEDVFHRARVLVSVQYGYAQKARLGEVARFDTLAMTAVDLAAAFTVADIGRALSAHLGELGMPSVILALSDELRRDLRSVTVDFVYPRELAGGTALPYRVGGLYEVPRAFFPSDRRWTMKMEILCHEGWYMGYMFVEMGPLNTALYDSLRSLVGYALYAVYTREGRRRIRENLLRSETVARILTRDAGDDGARTRRGSVRGERPDGVDGGGYPVTSAAAIIDYLSARIDEMTDVGAAADFFGVSKSGIMRTAKARTGYTLQSLHEMLKIERAKTLLATPEMKIADISVALGYQNPCYFSAVFKKNTGVSPLAWRRRSGIG